MASTAVQKGNRGQRKAVDCLRKWARKKFKSSAQYGGGGYNLDPHKGDILCDTEGHYFPFTVEVKNYKEINFCQLLQPKLKNVLILDFWAQCEGDAQRCKKVPMLMMRFNGLPADFFFIVITSEFYARLNMLTRALNCRKTLEFWDKDKGAALMIMPSNEFFRMNYKEVKLEARKYLKAIYK